MTEKHHFLFKKGIWLGQGKIRLSLSDEPLRFYMKWKVDPYRKSERIKGLQEIQITGLSEIMHNQIKISDMSQTHFTLTLENPSIGKVTGNGIISEKVVGWEFRDENQSFEGFEFYELKSSGEYFMHAEYSSKNLLKTEIQGKLWLKSESCKVKK